ncbi:acetylornithine transaminase [Brevibacterium sp. 50QC2O2]|uniref:acetylornithine transaminase n=1 Tax=Brevibacterium sp. 50QC2O2 TaxID=2968459 RepID=UPI00211C4BED|nr:acetylornithine transaminase [Brevibacterium sp. 50QC2O2]MCQ9387922.1 acetylornithine transaminase [Brevibacterium sp. 50QC2O2]
MADQTQPQTTATGWRTAHEHSILPAIGRPQLLLDHGRGAHVWDSDGKEYIDLLAGIAVNALGHAHPDYVAAVSHQVATLAQISNYFASEPQIHLATRILEHAKAPGGSAVYFANSGSEANETALKMSRRVAGGTRTKVIAVEGSFHGRTMGSLALTSNPKYREPFTPGVPGVVFVPFGDIAALEAEIDDTTAAMFIEPIQGEGGVRNHPQGYLTAARELTRAHGALLVLDEVQTGMGRCGAWFAHQHPLIGEGVVPDIMTLAKGLGGGLPIGATVTFGSEVTNLLVPGQHGSTYSGNPVVTAAGNAVFDVFERDGLVGRAEAVGQEFADALAKVDGVVAVSGAGLLRAFEVADLDSHDVVDAALAAGYITNAVTPSKVRLAPPLIIDDADLMAFVDDLPGILAAAQKSAPTPTEA